ncbi:tetratricopeptide repeat protein [Bradyrhizobium sp. ORS 111]|uniref:tetratricopeptide repeat protein n=1 Tax=Bradyrhizobium sp. ORS 111 TaxID=1685958 RepID=UPI00389062D3
MARGRWLQFAAVLPLLMWAGWQSVTVTIGWNATAHSGTAVAVDTRNEDALVELAADRLNAAITDADVSQVERLSSEALVLAPTATEPIRLLALASERRGNAARAEQWMRLAEKRARRNPLIEGWLFDRLFARGDFSGALERADAVLRSSPPRLRDRVRATLIRIAADARVIPALAEVLSAAPPWRSRFLATFLADPTHLDLSEALLKRMAARSHPPTPEELYPYLDALISRNQFERAYQTWLDFMAPGDVDQIPYVYNGRFEHPVRRSPFDWILTREALVDATVADGPPPASGKVLRIEFVEGRIAQPIATKLLMLPPGTFLLSSRVMAQSLINERGLRWTLSCASGEGGVLASTDRVSGTTPWRILDARFEVPQACEAQWLRLEIAARVALEQQIRGVIWFGDISVKRSDRLRRTDR